MPRLTLLLPPLTCTVAVRQWSGLLARSHRASEEQASASDTLRAALGENLLAGGRRRAALTHDLLAGSKRRVNTGRKPAGRRLELILVGRLNDVAHAAGRGADAVHEPLVVIALAVLGPPLAALVVIHADGGADLRGRQGPRTVGRLVSTSWARACVACAHIPDAAGGSAAPISCSGLHSRPRGICDLPARGRLLRGSPRKSRGTPS